MRAVEHSHHATALHAWTLPEPATAALLIRVPDPHALVTMKDGVVLQSQHAALTVADPLVGVRVFPYAMRVGNLTAEPSLVDHAAQLGHIEPKTGV